MCRWGGRGGLRTLFPSWFQYLSSKTTLYRSPGCTMPHPLSLANMSRINYPHRPSHTFTRWFCKRTGLIGENLRWIFLPPSHLGIIVALGLDRLGPSRIIYDGLCPPPPHPPSSPPWVGQGWKGVGSLSNRSVLWWPVCGMCDVCKLSSWPFPASWVTGTSHHINQTVSSDLEQKNVSFIDPCPKAAWLFFLAGFASWMVCWEPSYQ